MEPVNFPPLASSGALCVTEGGGAEVAAIVIVVVSAVIASAAKRCSPLLVSRLSLVSVELTGRLRVSPFTTCLNWRGRAPTAANANPSGESAGGSLVPDE